MEEAVLLCKESWGFNAVILGDELIVPEAFRYEVKDLMQRLVFEHAQFKGSIKVTTREGEESFMHPDLVPESSGPNPVIDGRCEIEGKMHDVCSIGTEGLAPEIIERMQQLLKAMRTPAKFTKEKLFVPTIKGPSTENLLNNVISNRN
jgi:hypothetical protein